MILIFGAIFLAGFVIYLFLKNGKPFVAKTKDDKKEGIS